MFERTQSFDMNGMDYTGIQIKIENILQKKLNYSTNSVKLGDTLLRITYFNEKIDQEKQKSNRITILQEPEKKVYIQVKGQLTDDQVEKIWKELQINLKITKKYKEAKEIHPTKDEIINIIIKSVKLKGYSIDNNDAYSFLKNFQEKYNRMPINQEIESIVKGYIIMMNEDYLLKKTKPSIEKQPFSENDESFMGRSDIETSSDSNNSSESVTDSSGSRRKCPSCGDQGSIHEVTDKSQLIMDYPRIYGKKKYCGNCGFEWKK